MMKIVRDERGIIVSWLVKIVLGLAVFGVIAYDAGSIIVNYFNLDSKAEEIAVDLSTDIASGTQLSARDVEARAKQVAKTSGARLMRAELDEAGVLHIELRRRANTLLVGRVGAIQDWARADVDATAGTRPATPDT